MSAREDGGSAFPEIYTDKCSDDNGRVWGDTYSSGGMSLRDWFAGQAISGLVAGAVSRGKEKSDGIAIHVSLSSTAYAIADQMLLDRVKGQP